MDSVKPTTRTEWCHHGEAEFCERCSPSGGGIIQKGPERQDVLPDCRTHKVTNEVTVAGTLKRPIFCGNCGAPGGLVPSDPNLCDFAFWLCNKCGEKWGEVAGTYTTSDEVFWEKVKQAELEKYGRSLTAEEQMEALADPNSPHYKLAKER
jgi:hypothetical protein